MYERERPQHDKQKKQIASLSSFLSTLKMLNKIKLFFCTPVIKSAKLVDKVNNLLNKPSHISKIENNNVLNGRSLSVLNCFFNYV